MAAPALLNSSSWIIADDADTGRLSIFLHVLFVMLTATSVVQPMAVRQQPPLQTLELPVYVQPSTAPASIVSEIGNDKLPAVVSCILLYSCALLMHQLKLALRATAQLLRPEHLAAQMQSLMWQCQVKHAGCVTACHAMAW